jgi:cyanophycin synthetase
MRSGARVGSTEIVIDEAEAVRRALDRSRPGDLVVLCADHAGEVLRELEARRAGGGDGRASAKAGVAELDA